MFVSVGTVDGESQYLPLKNRTNQTIKAAVTYVQLFQYLLTVFYIQESLNTKSSYKTLSLFLAVIIID